MPLIPGLVVHITAPVGMHEQIASLVEESAFSEHCVCVAAVYGQLVLWRFCARFNSQTSAVAVVVVSFCLRSLIAFDAVGLEI